MLAKSNKFECDTCGSHQEAQRAIKIRAAPACLILHLKRFKFIEQLRRCDWQLGVWAPGCIGLGMTLGEHVCVYLPDVLL